ncbi:MAG TPA: hypothetical protein VKT80_10960 [Chloroflexota bacterium]|nr:hypothetical protein [Chloroflexota bacterium]
MGERFSAKARLLVCYLFPVPFSPVDLACLGLREVFPREVLGLPPWRNLDGDGAGISSGPDFLNPCGRLLQNYSHMFEDRLRRHLRHGVRGDEARDGVLVNE